MSKSRPGAATQPPATPSQVEGFERHLSGLRNFSQAYTESTLSRHRTQEGVDKVIRKIDLMADREIRAIHEANAISAQQGKLPPLACKKGCAYCCHQPVVATVPEALHVAGHVRATFSAQELAFLKTRLAGYAAAKRAFSGEDFVHPCPLLADDDSCSAYEARPLACRGQNSFDVDSCRRANEAPSKVKVPCSKNQIGVAQWLQTGLGIGLTNSEVTGDLVQFVEALSLALDSEDAAERYFAGEPLFEGVGA